MALERREFLKLGAGGLVAAGAPGATAGSLGRQSYGSRAGRVDFGAFWRDAPGTAFRRETHEDFERLETRYDVAYARATQVLPALEAGPLRAELKLLCPGDVGRTLFTLGIKSAAHGCWAFSLGASPEWNGVVAPTGWQLVVNAADPWRERTSVAGLENQDWHTFTLTIPGPAGPARLHCDGDHVFDLTVPVTPEAAERVRREQRSRHPSLRQIVPSAAGPESFAFLESRHPGQVLDVDWFEVAQSPPRTRRTTLPVLRDLDWELEGAGLVENTLVPFDGNPVLAAPPSPGGPGRRGGADHPTVVRSERGFEMFFNAGSGSLALDGRPIPAIYRAVSEDGLRWRLDPERPVLEPGAPGTWDAGGLGQRGIVREGGRLRMWYGGYVAEMPQGRAGYAESTDGVHWTRPVLGLHTFDGRASNIVLPLLPGLYTNEYALPQSVVRADEAPPSRRYLMFLHSQGPRGFIVDVAASPDGRRWRRVAHNARRHGFDEVPRHTALHPAAVVLHERDYFWAFVGHHAPGGIASLRFVGWAVEPGAGDQIGHGLWRSRRAHLDSEVEAPRAGTLLEVGDEWWLYYTVRGNVHLARVGRHRMFGIEIEPGHAAGTLTTLVFGRPAGGWSDRRFEVNCSGFASGSRLTAELVDPTGAVLRGFAASDARPVAADGPAEPLEWRGGRAPSGAGRGLRVRLRLERGQGNPQVHAIYLR
jgi:hypothetical protein